MFKRKKNKGSHFEDQKNMTSIETIIDLILKIQDGSGKTVQNLKIVPEIQLQDDTAIILLNVDPALGTGLEPMRQNVEKHVQETYADYIKSVTVILTAKTSAKNPTANNQNPNTAAIKGKVHSAAPDPHGLSKNPKLAPPIKHIIAIASGKGGVGKSTIAANIAVSLANNNQKTGLLDADIYGPSQPRMFGLEGRKPDGQKGQIVPLNAHGLKLMSIGFLLNDKAPLVWRGPMVQTAIYQMLRDVVWGTDNDPLDILVVDMPPGTGDAQLTMAQKVPLSGAIIVSTPQDIALLDARKGVEMFNKVDVPILGMIENMSTHICANCGHEDHIFGHGGARIEAKNLDIPFLGELPLHKDIRNYSDKGTPISIAKPNSPYARTFDNIAKQIIQSLT